MPVSNVVDGGGSAITLYVCQAPMLAAAAVAAFYMYMCTLVCARHQVFCGNFAEMTFGGSYHEGLTYESVYYVNTLIFQ